VHNATRFGTTLNGLLTLCFAGLAVAGLSCAGCASQQTQTSLDGRAAEQDVAGADPFRPPLHPVEGVDSAVFPASHPVQGARARAASARQFSVYGELPRQHSPAFISELPFDATENLQQMTFASEGADFDPCVSPDGKVIYFASTRHRPTADIYAQVIGGTSVTQLTNDAAHDVMPEVSPDGTRIAFASNRNGSWDIYIMNVTGGQAVRVTDDTGHELHPSWSPDGSKLVYCRLSETSDRWEIWVAELDQPASRTFLTFGLFPSWQPGGSKIAFQRSRERGDRLFSLWTVDFVNGQAVSPTEIISSPTAAAVNPSWSADGQFLSFAAVYEPGEGESGERPRFADIWVMKADGTMRTNLTSGSFVNLMPTWGPDGRLFFVSDRSGTDSVWAVPTEQAILAAFPGSATSPEAHEEYVEQPVSGEETTETPH